MIIFLVYDIESYSNLFCIDFYDGKNHYQFEISEYKDERKKLLNFIKQDLILIGYNNSRFDDIVLNFIKQYQCSSSDIQNICKETINYFQNNSKNEIIKELKDTIDFKTIDLMVLANLQKSLKLVGISLKWKNIQDLPYPIDSILNKYQIEKVKIYNQNDTEMTWKLKEKLSKEIQLRKDLSEKYNQNFLSCSDSQISSILFESEYKKKIENKLKELKPESYEYISLYNHLSIYKKLRTFRAFINLDNIVVKNIQFKTKSLIIFLNDLKKLSLMNNEGFKIDVPLFKYNDKKYQFGIGGLHSDDESNLYQEDMNYKLIDADVTSFYPSIILNYKIKPEHLDDAFFECMQDFKNDRVKAKKEKDNVKADGLKIVINSAFGKFGFENYFFYDEQAMIGVTLNGQLFLMMLIEMLNMGGFEVISANTDGVLCRILKNKEEEYKSICKEWEKLTGFELEFKDYKKYVRTNVNNYAALDFKDTIKSKGLFETEPKLQQSFFAPIIAICLQKYYFENIPIIETLKNHKDIYDFCMSQKMGKQFTAEFNGEEIQKTCRFFASKGKGSSVLRKYKNDESNKSYTVLAFGKTVKLFNQYYDSQDYDIDYEFYLKECYKIISEINKSSEGVFEISSLSDNSEKEILIPIRKSRKKAESEFLW